MATAKALQAVVQTVPTLGQAFIAWGCFLGRQSTHLISEMPPVNAFGMRLMGHLNMIVAVVLVMPPRQSILTLTEVSLLYNQSSPQTLPYWLQHGLLN
jgi:uncharacterized membrane protein HdeD (DUF308 family)